MYIGTYLSCHQKTCCHLVYIYIYNTHSLTKDTHTHTHTCAHFADAVAEEKGVCVYHVVKKFT